MKTMIYNWAKEKVGEITLPSEFELEPDIHLMHRYWLYLQAAGKLALARTKTRGEVAGGGRKPWRQKGTGRARQGSIRAPQWRGGGVVFGPTNLKNPFQKMNKKERRKALLMGLITLIREKRFFIVEDFRVKSHKTKDFLKFILPLKEVASLLLVVDQPQDELKLAVRNLADIKMVEPSTLNFSDLFAFEKVVFTKSAFFKMLSLILGRNLSERDVLKEPQVKAGKGKKAGER